MLRIDMVFERDDATVVPLRDSLRDALHMLDLPPTWTESGVGADSFPPVAHKVGLPNVLIEGRPVSRNASPSRAQMLMALQDVLSRR